MGGFFERLQTLDPQLDWGRWETESRTRLERFAVACPLYAAVLERNPLLAFWLEDPGTLRHPHGFHRLLTDWSNLRAEHGSPTRDAPGYPGLLRRFRRRMSMRIAYRDVAAIADGAEIVDEITRLAEFCLRECMFIARELWTRRLGEPWDEQLGKPARFCVLGLGKLGGEELNFSSDVDLLYLYEGEGHTRRDARPTTTPNSEYFHRVGETLTQLLNERDASGFLFRADLRLRPGGAMAPLVPSIEAVENYYAATSQTWERLALLKARPVAGDLALGAELLENLHSFRYPRHPPPSLLSEVASMKQRTEREVVGADALERDVKSGFGGIREIEFFTQSMQLLRAARFPFLQTHSTIEALNQLVRYGLLEAGDATFLQEAYWFLRRVEHRVQMADERQTHELPADPGQRRIVAESLGFATLEAFDERLREVRGRVRELYSGLFAQATPAAANLADEWWSFFADGRISDRVAAQLREWFGNREDAAGRLRAFVRESESKPLLRDQVARFTDLIPSFDRVVPRLARPIETLKRISHFGDRYASRAQFLSACVMNREFFEVLALLFDRSRFIYELLVCHPEIFDEVIRPEILRKQKDLETRLRELADHPDEPGRYEAWLRLFSRAEQVRAAIGHLLGLIDDEGVARQLAEIAEAALVALVRRTPGADRLLVVALGRFGGGELCFGSDLDLLFVATDAYTREAEPIVRLLQRRLGPGGGLDAPYHFDLRLRPHGHDGPLVPGIAALSEYLASSAQTWERQALTRARVLCGPTELVEKWERVIDQRVFGRALEPGEADQLWRMRLRVQNERDVATPPERAFKTGAGGLIDIEFALQILQLRHGPALPAVRTPGTQAGWRALVRHGLADAAATDQLLSHYRQLRCVEFALRRDANRPASILPEGPLEQRSLARWLGAQEWSEFWHEHCARMRETRQLASGALRGCVSSTTLEANR